MPTGSGDRLPEGSIAPEAGVTTPGFVRYMQEDIPGQINNLRLHPLGPKPKVPGAHLSQVLPTTFGRHWHWPPLGSQTELNEP